MDKQKVTRPNPYCRGLIIAREPRIILSSSDLTLAPLGVASLLPEFFRREASLHFLSPSWTIIDRVEKLAIHLRQAAIELPQARFIILASDESELHALHKAGLEAMLGNHNIFINERVFRPLSAEPANEFDAIYVAQFAPFKNHFLCAGIDRLALVHWRNAHGNEQEVRAMLPHAHILNEENESRIYQKLTPHEVAAAVNRAATGLCLSTVEGAMRASMEYLLCGTPVVSIRSRGGRDRYLLQPYAEFAVPDSESVALAVQRLKNRRLPRAVVREYMATLLTFERRNFLEAINLRIVDMFGPGKEITDFDMFRQSSTLLFRTTDKWRAELQS